MIQLAGPGLAIRLPFAAATLLAAANLTREGFLPLEII